MTAARYEAERKAAAERADDLGIEATRVEPELEQPDTDEAADLAAVDAMARRRIQYLLGRMPYGAAAHFQWSAPRWSGRAPAPTLDDIEANLERLRAVLERVAQDDEARMAELLRNRRALAAAGELAEVIQTYATNLEALEAEATIDTAAAEPTGVTHETPAAR